MSDDSIPMDVLMECTAPIVVTDMTLARKLLRLHEFCSGNVCEKRFSAIRFTDAMFESDSKGKNAR